MKQVKMGRIEIVLVLWTLFNVSATLCSANEPLWPQRLPNYYFEGNDDGQQLSELLMQTNGGRDVSSWKRGPVAVVAPAQPMASPKLRRRQLIKTTTRPLIPPSVLLNPPSWIVFPHQINPRMCYIKTIFSYREYPCPIVTRPTTSYFRGCRSGVDDCFLARFFPTTTTIAPTFSFPYPFYR